MSLDEINKHLKTRELDSYQIQCILNQIHIYEKENESVKMITFDVCPKCSAKNPKLIKAGKTKAGKQMFQCCQCNHRFVADYGHVTFYSHQKHSKWLQLMEDTLTGVSLRKTAENIHVHPVTAFRMRHKFLRALEKSLDFETIIGEVGEVDETYSRNNHKGKKIPGIESKKRGTPGKAGLSKDQVCIITAVGRNGGTYAKAYNMGKPSEDDAFNMTDHIAEHSYFFSDKTRCYDHLMYEKDCTLHKVDKYHQDRVNNLNKVNSFHSLVKAALRRYHGVSSKYINRYAALFAVQRELSGLNIHDQKIKVELSLHKIAGYMQIRFLGIKDIFHPAINQLNQTSEKNEQAQADTSRLLTDTLEF